MGTCALALEFDTQEMGTAHAFRVGADSGLNPDWELGTFCPTFRQFLDSFTPETNARMADFPDLEPLPDDQIRTLQQSLLEAGHYLGRFSANEQIHAVERSAALLSDALRREETAFRDGKKLCLALPAVAGALLVILLV